MLRFRKRVFGAWGIDVDMWTYFLTSFISLGSVVLKIGNKRAYGIQVPFLNP